MSTTIIVSCAVALVVSETVKALNVIFWLSSGYMYCMYPKYRHSWFNHLTLIPAFSLQIKHNELIKELKARVRDYWEINHRLKKITTKKEKAFWMDEN